MRKRKRKKEIMKSRRRRQVDYSPISMKRQKPLSGHFGKE